MKSNGSNITCVGDAGSFPGPGWMPKQAHMADLQAEAEAAVANLLDAFAGKPASHRFKAELMCIIDTRSSGMFVMRTEQRNVVLPPFVGFHWAKRFFERAYLRKYRR
jgi:sulfide:quinone oxidoreductase